ncbi:recombinase family protein [Klebsiella pneumoniae]|uniref:recombinase family protein n=1 Tax=Klebsiella pneumoniae TaxID=573 RepID=UPI0021626541|nr:recombinase family protein [Klebsiella pneumoniae]
MGHRAAIYCRVSTADQSCERQEFDLRAFAGRAGYDVVGIFKETGSGTTAAWRLQIENRPGSSCCCRTPRRICML